VTVAGVSEKGGVGKTTTACAMAGVWAESGGGVLVVDLCPQGSATLTLSDDGTNATAPDLLRGDRGLDACVHPSSFGGIDLVPCSDDIVQVSHDRGRLRDTLQRSGYDRVIIDCPPSPRGPLIDGMRAADGVIAPVNGDPSSLRRSAKTLERIEEINEHTDQSIESRVLLAIIDERERVQTQVVEHARESFVTFDTLIHDDVKVRESALRGPVTHLRDSSRAADEYQSLAQEVEQWLA